MSSLFPLGQEAKWPLTKKGINADDDLHEMCICSCIWMDANSEIIATV